MQIVENPETMSEKVKYYLHFKGGLYKYIGVSKYTEDPSKELVIYQAMYGERGLWARPKEMFFSNIERDGYSGPRFAEISEKEALARMNTLPREATKIDIDDWELSGGGGNGLSYNHKKDDSIILKMNKASLPREHTEREFQKSQSLHGMGISCPEVKDFVTDGKRYGLIIEKVKEKKSFAKIISEDPGQLETIAKEFARRAKELHRVRCDNGLFPSYRENFLEHLSQSKVLSGKEKRILRDALDSMENAVTCIHGDLTPGNIIRAGEKDYWIDLGEVTYGDPDIDFGNMMFICNYVPVKLVDYLYHISREQFRKFVETYAQEYFGERWGTKELNEKLHYVLLLKAGSSVLKRPASAILYKPLISGHMRRYRILNAIMNVLVTRP